MSEKRRGLGRGLGALIPTSLDGARSTRERPVDVFFPDARPQAADDTDATAVATLDGERATQDGVDAVAASEPGANGLAIASDSIASASEGTSERTVAADGLRATAAASTEATSTTDATPTDAADGHVAGPAEPAQGTGAFDGLHGDLAEVPAPRTSGDPGGEDETGTQDKAGTQDEAGSEDQSGSDDETGLVPVPGAVFAELPLDEIRPNPRQPRSVFDEDALDELVGSIREIGVLQPVVVRRAGDGYELIMGERRWRAAGAAGLEAIPAIIRETGDEDLLRDALLENLHRSQLNPLEEAAAYQQLLDDFGCTHDELATRLHRSRPQISNTLRLLKLPPLVQRRVAAGVLSAGHARALLGLADGAAIERLAQRIVAEGLSVRAVEEIVALGGDGAVAKRRAAPRAGVRNEALDALAGRLSDRFETRVKVALGKSRGRLTVEFASVQDLNRILNTLAPEDPGLFHG